jgi:hypothetical protein
LFETVPQRRHRKVARYLQHFDLWLRHTRYKSLSDGLLPIEAYVYFYLSHISLHPGPAILVEPKDYYLPWHIDELLIDRKLKGFGRLSSRQAASRIAAAMKWQEHRFGQNLDFLRSQMKKLYRQATRFVQTPELTVRANLHSAECLELVSSTCRGLDNWVRDLAMLCLLQETECTTCDLAKTQCGDVICEWVDDWRFQFGNEKKARLSEGTAMLLQVLLGRYHHLAYYRGENQRLFSMGDAQVEFAMAADDVDVVLERRYRFALMITSVNCTPVVDLYDPGADPFPEGFVSERQVIRSPYEKPKKVVNLQFSPDNDNRLELAGPTALDEQYFYVDWDEAIRNARIASTAGGNTSTSCKPNALEKAGLRNGRVFITEEDDDNDASGADWHEH